MAARCAAGDKTTTGASRPHRVADGWRVRELKELLRFAGPAVLASVAYMDPGNFATNIQAGAAYAYELLWVVVLASLMAMLFQTMSAKIGIVTGRNLAELCRDNFPKPIVWCMWVAAEIAAVATDLSEFLGGTIGLSLLFHAPLLVGMLATAAITWGILHFERSESRALELLIGALVGIVGVSYLTELVLVPADWRAATVHAVVPHLSNAGAVTLAAGIVGATVMPHAIYLHSDLTQRRAATAGRDDAVRRRLITYSNREVVVALGFAALVNIAMVMMASAAFHQGHRNVAGIATAYESLVPALGQSAAGAFLLALMASGISSSAVGTLAGQITMQGFVGFRIPLWVRRVATMAPPFAVMATGYSVDEALVLSQVVLSLVLPVPLVSLLVLSRRRGVMGDLAVGPRTWAAAAVAAGLVLALNLALVLQTFGLGLLGPLWPGASTVPGV